MRVSEMLRKAAESTLFTLVTFVFGRLGDLQREAGGAPATPARFGLPAIRELYRVLVALANPRDLQYTDTMRLLALNTLQSAFQRACYTMAEFPALRELTLGDLSHSLLLILQRDQPALIAPALRVLYLLFASHRRYTKGHLELFLCQTLGRIMALPAVARQGPRRPPRLGGGSGSGQSTPRAGGPQPAAGQDAAAGLGIGGPAEKAAGRAGGSRRPSVASVYGHSESDVVRCVLPPLLESECALTYEQEVELYGDASLRAGTRGRLATLETRRQLVEGLHHLLIGDESLITDLWVNYDCDMQSGDMFDYVTAFVAHRAVPWPDAPGDGEDEAFRDIMLYHLVRIAGRAGVAPPAGKWAQLLGLPAAAAAAAEPAAASPAPVAGGAAPGQRLTLVQLKDRKRHKDTMMRAAR
ncbi:GDP/GTP exchange factor for ARF, partial [Coemansia nantahalensis]